MRLLGEKEVGDAGKHSGKPAESRDEGGPAQVGEGQQVERVADRQVALHGEGDDGEDARIGSAVAKRFFWLFSAGPTFLRGNFSSYRRRCQRARGTDANTAATHWGDL